MCYKTASRRHKCMPSADCEQIGQGAAGDSCSRRASVVFNQGLAFPHHDVVINPADTGQRQAQALILDGADSFGPRPRR